MEAATLLLVSHHAALAQVVGGVFANQHYRLYVADDPDEAVRLLERDHCAAVLLDARDLSLCPTLRTRWSGPIVLLVSPEAKGTILRGYQCGADSHISIPCDARELIARVQAVTRRNPGARGDVKGK